ncbi:hypothetical protein ACOSP7_030297 [Xanthoceras sorbifolium]
MGVIFSCFRQFWRPQKLPKEDSDDQKFGFAAAPIFKLIKPRCYWAPEEEKEKQKPQKQKQMSYNKVKERTLEEWLLASPDYVFNSYSHGDYDNAEESIAKIMMKKLLEVDNDNGGVTEEEEDHQSSSGKIKKKVSFKLPDEADIFIFYSSDSE